MALNPTFASASVNPSQTMGNDASVNPTQGALPTGAPATQNTGFSGLGQQPQQGQPKGMALPPPFDGTSGPGMPKMPQGTMVNGQFMSSPIRKYIENPSDVARFAGWQNYANQGGTQGWKDWSSQNYNQYEPQIDHPPPEQQQIGSPQMLRDIVGQQPSYPIGYDFTQEPQPIDETGFYQGNPQQPQAPYNNGQLRYDSGDNVMPQVGNLGNDVEIPKLNYLGYKPGWQQEADNTWSYNTENMSPYNQYDQDWKVNYIGYRGVPNDAYQKYQDALSRGESGDFSGNVMNQYTATTKPRYTSDFSQLGLSQTALDSLKNRPQDLGSYYYDTQTGMFNQGMGRPGPNIPGQRIYTGMSNIPLDVMNKLGSGEEIDFSPYRQYTNGFNTEGQPNPPQIGDQPLPVQQPQVLNGVTGTPASPLTPTATPTGTTPMATNPLSTYATTPTTGSTPAPTLNVTPGASSSGNFGQGGVLPNVTTTQQQVTAAPSFYTDYLNQLATRGGQAAQDAQYVGAQPLQEQAFNLASQNVGNYQPTLQNAINLASSVGNTNLAQAIGDVGQANIARNLSPQATAGIVGSGQFGSKRGAQALGDVIANAQLGLTAQQQQAMQQDMQNRISAAQQLGTLANSTQALGLGDVNALSTLGQQQQTIAQNQQLFPMQQLANQSALLRGYTIPTSSSASQTGPGQQGQFQTSPLQQIMSVGTLLGALAKPGADYIDPKTGLLVKGTSAGGNLYGGLESLIKRLTSGTYTANPSTNTTTSTSIGDVSASMKTLPDGRPNPNYDAYADPNATDEDRMAQNLLNGGFDRSDPTNYDEIGSGGFDRSDPSNYDEI